MVIWFAASLALNGCAVSSRAREQGAQWVGQPISDLVAQVGMPDQNLNAPSGDDVYVYDSKNLYGGTLCRDEYYVRGGQIVGFQAHGIAIGCKGASGELHGQPNQKLASQSAAQAPESPGITPQMTLQRHEVAQGGVGEHDVVQFQSGYIDAFPNWAHLDHLVIHYNNGTTVWGKPTYGPDCTDAYTCRRANFRVNGSKNTLQAVTLDGRPVLQSALLQINDNAKGITFYMLNAPPNWFAGPDLPSVIAQAKQAEAQQAQPAVQQSQPQALASQPTGGHPYLSAVGTVLGAALGAALVLATVYVAAREQSIQSSQRSLQAMQPTTCYGRAQGSGYLTTCN